MKDQKKTKTGVIITAVIVGAIAIGVYLITIMTSGG